MQTKDYSYNNFSVNIETAPLAGYTDVGFRRVLIKCGARTVYTEMVSATALFYKSKKTLELLQFDKVDGVKTVVQLFGKVPEHFTYALKSGLLDSFDEININNGCPAPKITRNGEGSALMKTPELAAEIVRACVAATNKPVTVKCRLGFTQPISTVIEHAKMMEAAGASKLIVHGRYASQGYSGTADWHEIAKVTGAVKIPVYANGDIVDSASLQKCADITKANGFMMGRALLGSPWKVTLQDTPPINEIKDIIRLHLDSAVEFNIYYGELKKHLLHYANHLENPRELKLRLATSKSFDEARQILLS